MKETVDHLNSITQPVSVGLGGAVFLGLQLDDWVLIGTGVLILLNIFWGVVRLYDRFKRKENTNGST